MAFGHVLTKSYGHVFRFQFPKDIKPLVGKSEIRFSLKTHQLSLAKSRARMEISASIQVLVDVLGDIPVNTIDRSMMSEFKQTIIQLPPNMNKDLRYRRNATWIQGKPSPLGILRNYSGPRGTKVLP